MKDKYTGLSQEHFEKVKLKYETFLDRLNDVDREPTQVYKPLPKKALDDIKLIREISKDLQNKKDEDVKKQQKAKEEQKLEAAQQKAAEVKSEETEKEA